MPETINAVRKKKKKMQSQTTKALEATSTEWGTKVSGKSEFGGEKV